MALSKSDLLRLGRVEHQGDLVARLSKSSIIKPIKTLIPDGHNIHKTIFQDPEVLQEAIYTWLRRVRGFTKATISLARDPQSLNLKQRKVIEFQTTQLSPSAPARPVWEVVNEGRRYIANIVAEQILKERAIVVEIDCNGITIGTDPTGSFSPAREVHENDITAQAKLVEELKARLLKCDSQEKLVKISVETGIALPDLIQIWLQIKETGDFQFALLEVGDSVPNEEWEPYVEVWPVKTQEYGGR